MVREHYSHCLDCCRFGLGTNPRYSRLESFKNQKVALKLTRLHSHESDMLHLHPWLGLVNIVLGGLQ